MTNVSHSRFSSGAFLALILLNLGLLAYLGLGMRGNSLGPPDRMSGPHAPSQLGKFLERELQLRPDQLTQFEELKRTHREKTRRIRRSLRRSRQKLFDSLTKTSEEVSTITQQIGEAQQQIERATFQHFADLRAICDPAQQQKLDSMLKELLAKMAPPGPHGPPPHGGPPPRRPPGATPRPSLP